MTDGAERLKPPKTSEDAVDRDRGEQGRTMSAEVQERLLTLAGTAEQAAILEKAVSLFGELPVPERPGTRLVSAVEALPGDLRTSSEIAHLARFELANELLANSNRTWLAEALRTAGHEHVDRWPGLSRSDRHRLTVRSIRHLRDRLQDRRSALPEALDPLAFDGLAPWMSKWAHAAAVELVIEANRSTIEAAVRSGLSSFMESLGTSAVRNLESRAWGKVPRVISNLRGSSSGQLRESVKTMARRTGVDATRLQARERLSDPNDLRADTDDSDGSSRIAEAQRRGDQTTASILTLLEDTAAELPAQTADSDLGGPDPEIPQHLISPEILARQPSKIPEAAARVVAAALATTTRLMSYFREDLIGAEAADVPPELSSLVRQCYGEIHIAKRSSAESKVVESRRNEPSVLFAIRAAVVQAASSRTAGGGGGSLEAQGVAYSLDRTLCAVELEVITSRLATSSSDFGTDRCQALLDRARELILEIEGTLVDPAVPTVSRGLTELGWTLRDRFAAAVDKFEIPPDGKLFGSEPPPIDAHQAVLADEDRSAAARARPEVAHTLYRELTTSTVAQLTDGAEPRQRLAELGNRLTQRFVRLSAVRCRTEATWVETTLEALSNVDGWVEAARSSLDGLHRSLPKDDLKAAKDAELIEVSGSDGNSVTLVGFCQRLADQREAPPHLRQRATVILELRETLQTFVDANARTSEEKD